MLPMAPPYVALPPVRPRPETVLERVLISVVEKEDAAFQRGAAALDDGVVRAETVDRQAEPRRPEAGS